MLANPLPPLLFVTHIISLCHFMDTRACASASIFLSSDPLVRYGESFGKKSNFFTNVNSAFFGIGMCQIFLRLFKMVTNQIERSKLK